MGIQRVPNLLRWTGLTCRLPYPGGPKGARGCCFPSGVSLHPFVKGSATTMVLSRLQSSLQVTARELASPPFEDVYVRAGTDAGHPESASNMTTWVNSQFPRPDFHRQVHRHYGLHNKLRPKLPRHSSTLHGYCRRIHGRAANRYTERNYTMTLPVPRCLRVPEAPPRP